MMADTNNGGTHAGCYPMSAMLALSVLRIAGSWNWINGAFFGADAKSSLAWLSGSGLVERIGGAGGFAAKAMYPWVGDIITQDIATHPTFWAFFIFLAYAVPGISLCLGLFTRVGGLVAILASLMNLLAAAGNGADTIGQNVLLLLIGALCMLTGAGRAYGIDGWLLAHYSARWLRIVA
ncbi:TQO small subunit DoxD [Edwardsiella tarda]|uniref:TQO small subunit DoxD n=2 Tax=Edwardsiella tarda TaxID=636 RepID=UPI000310A36D